MSSTPPAILNKIKLLKGLSQSPNPHEAESARQLAEKLIEKHNVSEGELSSLDPKPLYGENEKLFTTIGPVHWRQQLAVSIAAHFDCQIVQVELVPAEGPHPFEHYVYGETDNVNNVKATFYSFNSKVEHLINTKCLGRTSVYVSSYAEGVVDAIRENIILYGIDLPEVVRPIKNDKAIVPTIETIEKPKDRPAPANERIDISGKTFVQDIAAYFNGLYDGKDLFLDNTLLPTNVFSNSLDEFDDED